MKKDKWTPTDGIELENAAINAIKSDRNVLITAGPGAGKTELLVQKAGYLFSTEICHFPKKILAISFKKDAAENLKKRIIKRFGEEYKNRFVSLTYDAFFKNIVDRFYRALPDDYIIDPQYGIADDGILKERLKRVGYQQPTDMTEREFKRHCMHLINATPIPIEKNVLLKEFWSLMLRGNDKEKAALSFQMIAKLALLLLQTNTYIKKIICSTFSQVFLDEFQDTTEIQYMIVKELFMNSSVKITAVGDTKQRIMMWAGAQKTIFDDFTIDFSADKYQMVMNHRSAPRLVALQKEMYKALREENVDIKYSEQWNEEDGKINLIIADNEKTEAEYLAKMIENDILEGTKVGDICILCKQLAEKYSQEIIVALKDKGIRARIENDYQNLLKDDLIKLLINIILLSSDRKNPEAWDELMAFCIGFLPQTMESNEKYYDLIKSIDNMLDVIKEKLAENKSEDNLNITLKYIIDFWGEEGIKAYFPEYNQGTYLNDRLKKFSELLWIEIIAANKVWKDAIDNFNGKNSISIMTIHKSKGLEYSSVYFLGLEDSAFWNFKNQPEEDRCAFFVAISRAKQKISFTYCRYRYNLSHFEQKRTEINEFYELLQKHRMAEIFYAKELQL